MLQAQGLSHRYAGAVQALSFPDFAAEGGEQVLLRGPSGSGKSTLLALMAGLLRVQAGHLRVAGTDLAGLDARAADRWRGQCLGVVPQRLHLSPGLTLRDNLRLVAFARGEAADEARIDAVLKRLGLQAQAAQKPSALSAGQAQRAALARALLGRPQVLLADEPTANLDDRAAEQALGLLAEVAQESAATLVLATHDSRVVQRLRGARVWQLRGEDDT
jgi:putative ABC transport system ATP-binding protein